MPVNIVRQSTMAELEHRGTEILGAIYFSGDERA